MGSAFEQAAAAESLSQRAQLACIADVLARPIRVEQAAVAEGRAQLAAIVPPAYVALLLAQWADEDGRPAVVTSEVAAITGRPATPYARWVAGNAERFG